MRTIPPTGEHFSLEFMKLNHRVNNRKTKVDEVRSAQTTLPPADTPYRRLFEASLDGIMIIDGDTNQIMDVNPALIDMLGYNRWQFVGKRFPDINPFTSTTIDIAAYEELKSKGCIRHKVCLKTKEGKSITVELIGNVYLDNAREMIQFNFRYLADGKKIDHIPDSRARLLSEIIERSSQPVGIAYPDGSLAIINTAFSELLGYTERELYLLRFPAALTPPEFHEHESDMLAELRRDKKPVRYEKQYIRRDGTRVPVEVLLHLVEDEEIGCYYYAFVTDITERKQSEEKIRKSEERLTAAERKQAEAALRESEERFRQFAENFDHVIWFIHLDHEKVLFVSPAFERIWGIATADLYRNPKLWVESIYPEDRNRVREVFKGINSEANKCASYDMEYRIVRKDGTLRWIHDYGTKFYGQQGNLIRTSGIAEDITQRKEAENALRQMKEELDLRVADRTRELAESNARLQKELTERKQIENALKKRDLEIQARSRKLEEANVALKVLLKRIDEDKKELQKKLSSNIKHLITPYLEKLRRNHLSSALNETCLNIIETQLNNLFSPFSHKLSSDSLALTPKEIQVADLIREGKTSKEIADILHISKGVADFHRDHIRAKLGIKNHKGNLRTHLLSIR